MGRVMTSMIARRSPQTALSRRISIVVSTHGGLSPYLSSKLVAFSPRGAPLSLANSPCVLALNELIVPGAMVSLVNALLVATRRTTSNGATAYQVQHYIRRSVRRSCSRVSTDLSLNEDESIHSTVSSDRRYDDRQRAQREKRTGLDERGDCGLAQPPDSTSSSQGSMDGPAVSDESDDDHDGEKDVDRNRNRKVWYTEAA